MYYFQEALQNNPGFIIQMFAEESTSEIHEYLKPFFLQTMPGLHVLIMCLPFDAPQLDKCLIKKALSHQNDPCEPLPQSEETIPLDCTKRYFVVSSMLDSYEAALRELSEFAKRCYKKADMFSHAIRLSREDLLEKTIAKQLQKELQEAIDDADGHCHTLFAFLILPIHFYEEIKGGGKSLPSFFEYIVLGGGAPEAIQELKKQLKEKDAENKELRVENEKLNIDKEKLNVDNKKLKAENIVLKEELTKKDKARDDTIEKLTSYLHTVLINGALSVNESKSLKEVLDNMKQRDDLPDETREQIDEMVFIIHEKTKSINTKTRTM